MAIPETTRIAVCAQQKIERSLRDGTHAQAIRLRLVVVTRQERSSAEVGVYTFRVCTLRMCAVYFPNMLVGSVAWAEGAWGPSVIT